VIGITAAMRASSRPGSPRPDEPPHHGLHGPDHTPLASRSGDVLLGLQPPTAFRERLAAAGGTGKRKKNIWPSLLWNSFTKQRLPQEPWYVIVKSLQGLHARPDSVQTVPCCVHLKPMPKGIYALSHWPVRLVSTTE
jgi:hypothetical protein